MTESISQKLTDYLADRKQQGLYRTRVISNPQEKCLDFSCNDYLSLADDARVRAAYRTGFQRYPAGSGGSTG